jgi:thiol-disulfide isomerase/thioredoxin
MYRSIRVNLFVLFGLMMALMGCSQNAQFHYANGDSGRLTDFQGRITVVNYWAEWCKPCLKEIPELSELHHSFDDVEVIAINWDGIAGEPLNLAAEKLGIDFPMIIEDISPLLNKKKPEVLPTTYIFDTSGTLVATLVGPQTLTSLTKAVGK